MGALTTGAAPVPAETWVAATSPDGGLTVSTPCTAAEVEQLRSVPASALPLPVEPAGRVLCRKEIGMFVAGVVDVPAVPVGAASLFDFVSVRVRADAGVEGTPRALQVDGHRALLNSQQAGGRTAQTGIVEIDRLHVVMLVSGVEPGSGVTDADQIAMVDRFAASVRINQH